MRDVVWCCDLGVRCVDTMVTVMRSPMLVDIRDSEVSFSKYLPYFVFHMVRCRCLLAVVYTIYIISLKVDTDVYIIHSFVM